MIYQVERPPLTSGHQLPEGPRWHKGRLWFSDIRAGRLFSMSEDGETTMLAEFDEPCSGVGFLPDGTLLVTLMPSSRIVRVAESGAITLHADLSELDGDHVNDMITDSEGRCYVDRLSYTGTWPAPEDLPGGARRIPFVLKQEPPEVTDMIALVEPDGSSRIVAEGLLGPNGMAISPDGSRLVLSEWRASRISTFDIAPNGDLSNHTILCHMEGEGVRTDGLCLDEEGAVWFASPEAGECLRVSLSGEIVDQAKPLAGNHVMACVLGGQDRRTLYMMTNRRPEPTTGTIEVVRVDVPGAGRP
jgi:sugar lactone lactonase YvrE